MPPVVSNRRTEAQKINLGLFMCLLREVGQCVFSLILGPDATGASEAFASLFSQNIYSTISKKIRSNTHCPT